MKKLLVLLSLSILSIASASVANAQPRPEIAKYVKGYSGQEGIKVWMLRIGPTAQNEALVQIGGVDHDWDMGIQKMKLEPGQRGTKYVTTVDGKRFVALTLESSWGEVYLPGRNNSQAVYYSKQLSEQSNAEFFLTDFLKLED